MGPWLFPRSRLARFAVISSIVGGLAVAPALAQDKAPAAPPPTAPPAAAAPVIAIPVDEVATQAAQLPKLIRTLTEPLAPIAEIDAIRQRLPELHEQVDRDLAAAEGVLWDQPALDTIQAQYQLWQHQQLQATTWLELLTQRTTRLQETLKRLAELKATWRQTRSVSVALKVPGPIVAQIDGAVEAIEAAAEPLAVERTALLDLQSVVAQEVSRVDTVLARFKDAQNQAVGGLLTRGGRAVWAPDAWADARDTLWYRLQTVVTARRQDFVNYARDPVRGLSFHAVILVVLLAAFWMARRLMRVRAARGDAETLGVVVFEHPVAAAVLGTLLIASSPSSAVAPHLRNLFQVLSLVPVIWLTRRTIDPRLMPSAYAVGVLLAVDRFRQTIGGAPVLEQITLVLETFAGIAFAAHALTVGRLRRASGDEADAERLQAFRAGAGVVALVLGAAVVAGTVGYVRLARLIASGVLGSGALALTLYAAIHVLADVASFMLRVWPFRLLRMVQDHRQLLERRAYQVLLWWAIANWALRALDYVGLLQPAKSLGEAILAVQLGRGSISLSVGDIVEFVLTIGLAYLLSAFIRFVLQEDVYPHTRLPRGASYALSSLLNYVVLTLGLLLALGSLGLDLSKVTILAGAFGVGIGFGLQGVVNNFVSGLIVLFERPIQVGDVVEIGGLQGEVARIGIRASTVRTWQGAEIIIPNAQIVTERVVNWTRSDRRRRIELRVGVDYGTEPENVVKLLEGVAREHPQILKVPPPQAVFVAFADSAITFELQAWTDRFERWPTIATELAIAVYAALRAAGMKIPFAQHEVRLLQDAAPNSG